MTPRSRGITTRKATVAFVRKLVGFAVRLWHVAEIEAAKPAAKRFLTDDEIVAIAELRSHANRVIALLERQPGERNADSNGSNDATE